MLVATLSLAVAVIGAVLTLSLLLYKAQRETASVTHERDQTQKELELSRMKLEAQDEQILELAKRLSIAERQRNEAYGEAREHFIQRVQNAKLADASKLVADLLAAPIGGAAPVRSVLPKVPRSEDPIDGLLDPNS